MRSEVSLPLVSAEDRPKPPNKKDDEGDETGGTTTLEATFQRALEPRFVDLQPADKLKAILHISSVLSKTLDIKQLWPQIAEELFDLFRSADRCFVFEYQESDRSVHAVVTKTRRPTQTGASFIPAIVTKCVNSLESFLITDALSNELDPSIAAFRVGSAMCVPLAGQNNRPLGVILLDTGGTKNFTLDDLKLMTWVAAQASVTIENARIHEWAIW
jgi:GAF domain-containing protein